MPNYQTTVDNTLVARGSALVEVANYTSGDPSWFNVGALVGIKVTENMTIGKEENDNADSTDRVSKQELTIEFTRFQILDLDVWEIIRGNTDTIIQDSNEVTIMTGNKTTLPEFMVRLTMNNNDKPIYITAYRCTLQSGLSWEIQPDNAEDARLKEPMVILGKTDSNRGDLVFEIKSNYFKG